MVAHFVQGKKLSVTNSFVIKHPELAKEFHKNLNKDIDIDKLFENSGKKVWWK